MAIANEAQKGQSFILNTINQYNRQQAQDEAVKFLYPGTSVDLAWVGKTVTITKPKESEIVMVPHALIPKYLLRKKYGINPFLNEVNTRYRIERSLYGAMADKDGVMYCIDSSQHTKLYISIERLHERILETMIRTTPHNYLRSFSTIHMLMSNLKLLDPDLFAKGDLYLSLLGKEIEMLVAAGRDKIAVHQFCTKFLMQIRNILNSRLYIIQPNEQFRAEVTYQYPIVYCSTVDANSKGNKEFLKHYDNELSLSTIKMAFTPLQFVSQLQTKLKEIGFGELIKVYGYPGIVLNEHEKPKTKREYEQQFMHAVTPAEIVEITQKHSDLLQQQTLVEEKIAQSLKEFSEGKGEPSLAIAVWLLKHADLKALKNIEPVLARQDAFSLYMILKTKMREEPEYGELISELFPIDALTRLQKIPYIRTLLMLRREVKDNKILFDFRRRLSREELEAQLSPTLNEYPNRANFLRTYLCRLQAYFTVLTRETANSIEYAENINARLGLVRDLYTPLISEYMRNTTPAQMDEDILESELYQAVKDTLPHNRIWGKIKIFPFGRTKSAV